jgi:hypothetical protein
MREVMSDEREAACPSFVTRHYDSVKWPKR